MSKRRSWKEDLKIFTLAYFKQVRQLVVKAAIWGVGLMALACLAVTLIVAHDAYISKRMESQGLTYCWGKWRTPEEKAEAEQIVGFTYEEAQERDLKR